MKVHLTNRDLKLLYLLDEFGVLSTKQINYLLFSGVDYRTVLRRLRKLAAKKVILKSTGVKGGVSAWFLTKKGANIIGFQPKIKSVSRNTLRHDMIASDVRILLDRWGVFSSWRSSHTFKFKKAQIENSFGMALMPDWLCFYKDQPVAIEVELNDKAAYRIRSLISLYRGNQSIKRLWYFVSNKRIGRKIQRAVNDVLPYGENDDHWFIWSYLPEFLASPSEAPIYSGRKTYHPRDLFIFDQTAAHTSAHEVSKLSSFVQAV